MSGRIVAIAIGGLLVVSGVGLALYMAERPAPLPGEPVPRQVEPQVEAPEEPVALEEPSPRAPAPRPAAEPPVVPPEPVAVAPTTGSLKIESDVPGTSVFVDREFLGAAPVTKADLPPGSYRVVLSPPEFDMVSRTVEVVAGEEREVSVAFKIIVLDEVVAVVHKHRFGSCDGTLRASPEGLVYETTNENDGFVVSFHDLETFEVDYLNTNLLVKIRGGRTYNFTNAQGDVAPLFDFHRDVDKVRLRVVGGGVS